jgi:hypothetical protein
LDPGDAVEFVNNWNKFSSYVINEMGRQILFSPSWEIKGSLYGFYVVESKYGNQMLYHPTPVSKKS